MIKAVLFDIDGVLIDTLEGNRRTFNHAFEKLGARPISPDEYRGFYFVPAKSVFKHFLPEKSEKEIDGIIKSYLPTVRDFYRYNRINQHVIEVLQSLKKQFMLGIVTNRMNTQILEHFRMKEYFKAEVCLPDVKKHKPHPEPIHLALKRLNVKPEEALYVGDALSDLQAGKAAGVKVIIYRNPVVRGDWNITDFREILEIVNSLNKKWARFIPLPS